VEDGTRKLTDPEQLYLSKDDEQAHAFGQEVDAIFRSHGLLTDEDSFGTYPNLKEDHKCNQIEWKILDLTPEFDTWKMDVRERYFDLLLKLVDLLEG
jgi:hypothetical protein